MPPRIKVSVKTLPTGQFASTRCRSSTLPTSVPLIAITRSPGRTGQLGRALWIDGDGFERGIRVEVISRRQAAIQPPLPATDAEITPAHTTLGQQLRQHPLDGVRGDRKADALGHGNDRGVDADHAAVGIHQRPPGIARIQRRGVLDDVFNQPALGTAQAATERADRAGGDRGLEPRWAAADGDDQLADPQAVRISQRGIGQTRRRDTDHGEIGGRSSPTTCASALPPSLNDIVRCLVRCTTWLLVRI